MKRCLSILLFVIALGVKAITPIYDVEDGFPGFGKCVAVSIKGTFVSLRSIANGMDHCMAMASEVDKNYHESSIDRIEKKLIESGLEFAIGDTIYIKDSSYGVFMREYSFKEISKTFIWKKTSANDMPLFDNEFSPLRNKSQRLFEMINDWDVEKIYIDREIDNPFPPGYVQLCYDNSTTTFLFRIIRLSEKIFMVDCILTRWINN